jgi:acyl dehydratase
MAEDFQSRAKLRPKGHAYEDFDVGGKFEHHWGRTVTEGDNTLFSTLTLHYNPLYTNAEFARAHGHPGMVVNPMLVFTTVFGLTVEDLSEGGGAFLGVEELTFWKPVYPGDTLTARSTVLSKRESASNKSLGIVTWHSEGFNQHGDRVIDFRRTNQINKRSAR